MNIVAQSPAVTVTLIVARHGQYYFYTRLRDGVTEVMGERITAERAAEIISENEGAWKRVQGTVSFEPTSSDEWSVQIDAGEPAGGE